MPDTVTMMDSDGQAYDVPQESMKAAQGRGLNPAVMMTSPEGEAHWVPRSNAARAIKEHGFTVGQAPPKASSEDTPVTSNWEAAKGVAKDTWGAVKGAAQVFNSRKNPGEEDESALTANPVGRIVKGILQTGKDALQVPGAIHDINQSPDPTGTYLDVAQKTASQGAGQAIVGAVTEGARGLPGTAAGAKASSAAETAGRFAVKAGKGVIEEIPVVRKVLKAGKYGKEAAAETAARRTPPTYPGAPLPENPGVFPGAHLPEDPGVFPGAHLPEDPGTFPGANLPEAPSKAALQASSLQQGAKAVSNPSDALASVRRFPQYKATPPKITSLTGEQSSLPLIMGEEIGPGSASPHPDAAAFEKTFGQPIDNYVGPDGKFNVKDFLDEVVKPKTEPPNAVIAKTFGAEGVDLVNKLNGKPLAKWESSAPEGEAQGGSARLRAKQQAAEPNWAYRARDVGEKGVPRGSAAQFTSDMNHAKQYAVDKEGMSGVPQEVVKVDLNKLKPGDYTAKPGPRGGMWSTLTRDLGEHEVGLAEEPKAVKK